MCRTHPSMHCCVPTNATAPETAMQLATCANSLHITFCFASECFGKFDSVVHSWCRSGSDFPRLFLVVNGLFLVTQRNTSMLYAPTLPCCGLSHLFSSFVCFVCFSLMWSLPSTLSPFSRLPTAITVLCF